MIWPLVAAGVLGACAGGVGVLIVILHILTNQGESTMDKVKRKLRRLAQLAHGGRSPMCDCGACCDACGHDSCCMSRSENQ